MTAPLRIGIVGTGYLGRLHARILTEMPEVKVAGFVESNDAVAAEVAASLKIERFPSVEALAAEVEAAVVATTTSSHFDVATQLLAAGRHVLIEKPITSTVEDAKELIRQAEDRKLIIQIGHVERYNPAVRAAEPFIGKVRYIEAERLGVFVGRSLDIDVLLDLMIHDLNLVLTFVEGSVVDIRAVGIPVLTSQVDIANVRIEFSGGAVANLTASRVSADRVRKIRLFSGDSYVSIDTKEQEVKGHRLVAAASGRAIEPLSVPVTRVEPLRAELQSFAEVIRNRSVPLVTAGDGLAALELAIAVRKVIDSSMAHWKESL
jgi:predicted dehydrogenase